MGVDIKVQIKEVLFLKNSLKRSNFPKKVDVFNHLHKMPT